jgi:hypothetical protein
VSHFWPNAGKLDNELLIWFSGTTCSIHGFGLLTGPMCMTCNHQIDHSCNGLPRGHLHCETLVADRSNNVFMQNRFFMGSFLITISQPQLQSCLLGSWESLKKISDYLDQWVRVKINLSRYYNCPASGTATVDTI